MAIVFMMGRFTRRPKLALLTLGVMAFFSLVFIGSALWSESQPNVAVEGLAASQPNMEGKEQRFSPASSALWSTLTTQTSNGSVNAMHDSLNPVAGLVAISGMLINGIWGGIGCGLVNFLVYLLVTIFLSGLMIGRSPEIYGRKLEVGEMRLLSVLVLLQPVILLAATAVTLSIPSITGNSNPGFHGVSQVFYEYSSAFANNGSGFEGLGDATKWWNLSCAVVLLLGRYACFIIPLAVVGRLAMKRVAILQSNYIPWKGYFDLIASVDEFVLYDDMQFTRRDWRNRNKIKTPQGVQWLSVPVKVKGRYTQAIRETEIDGILVVLAKANLVRLQADIFGTAQHFFFQIVCQ